WTACSEATTARNTGRFNQSCSATCSALGAAARPAFGVESVRRSAAVLALRAFDVLLLRGLVAVPRRLVAVLARAFVGVDAVVAMVGPLLFRLNRRCVRVLAQLRRGGEACARRAQAVDSPCDVR